MRKIVANKEYVQLEDLVFMEYIEIDNIPDSLGKKLHDYCNNHTLFKEREKEYIELTSLEESIFIRSNNFILNKNYLDMLDNEKLKDELSNYMDEVEHIKQKNYTSFHNEDIEMEFKKIKYKFNSFVDYLNERIEKSCENCENYCYKNDSLKTGLDKDGKPVGSDCHRFLNSLVKVKKYEDSFNDYDI